MSEPSIWPIIAFIIAAVTVGTVFQGSMEIGNGFSYDYEDKPEGVHEP